jgi:lactoylglutathione lyase
MAPRTWDKDAGPLPALEGAIMRTLHVGLRVADLERSLAFYTAIGYEVLGDVPATELGSLTMLKLPGDEFVTLELVHDRDSGPVTSGGFSHLVIQVDDMQATRAQLAAGGIQTEEPGSPDGSADFWTAWVTDPDGYRIELVQWPDGHPDGMTRSDFTEPKQSP